MSVFKWSHNGRGRSPFGLDGGPPYAYAHGGRFSSGRTPYIHGSLPVIESTDSMINIFHGVKKLIL